MHWTVRLEGGPRRVNHAAVVLDGKIYSFGGFCSLENFEIRKPIDVCVLDTFTLRWTQLPSSPVEENEFSDAPYQRYGHTVVAFQGKAYLWGGRNDCDGASSLIHEFDPETRSWKALEVEGMIPASRDGHSACVIDDKMVVFGGFEEDFQRFSQETYAFDFATRSWAALEVKGRIPEWRDFHTATAVGSRMYVFGGRSDVMNEYHSNQEVYHDELRYLDFKDRTWHEPLSFGQPPTGRRSHSAWEYKGKLYIFGGYYGLSRTHYNTIHEYNPDTSDWKEIKAQGIGPGPRRRQCCVMLRNELFLFGGTAPIGQPVSHLTPGSGLSASLAQQIEDHLLDRNLDDLSDLHILDFDPSLRTLCMVTAIKNKLHENRLPHSLPWGIRMDLLAMTKPNKVTQGQGRTSLTG